MTSTDTRSPVSWRVHVARLPDKGMPVTWQADAESRAARIDRVLSMTEGLSDGSSVATRATRRGRYGFTAKAVPFRNTAAASLTAFSATASGMILIVATMSPALTSLRSSRQASVMAESTRLNRSTTSRAARNSPLTPEKTFTRPVVAGEKRRWSVGTAAASRAAASSSIRSPGESRATMTEAMPVLRRAAMSSCDNRRPFGNLPSAARTEWASTAPAASSMGTSPNFMIAGSPAEAED